MNQHPGRNVFKGINYQAVAALSLFLQYVGWTNFQYIEFEGKDLEDFCLHFISGKKIICEAKAYDISYSELKEIIRKVVAHGKIQQNDELVIICKKVSEDIKRHIDQIKYSSDIIEKIYIDENGFSWQEFELLSLVKFWEIDNEQAGKIAMFLLSILLSIWVPEHQLEKIADHILVNEVYKKSEKGKILTKINFFDLLDEEKQSILDDARYKASNEQKERELQEIINNINDPESQQWSNNKIMLLSNESDMMRFVLRLLNTNTTINLEPWNDLWVACAQYFYTRELFIIFKKNMGTPENRQYFIRFIKNMFDETANYFRDSFTKSDVVDVLYEIIKEDNELDREVFTLINDLYKPSISRFFLGNKNQDDSYVDQQVSKLLLILYEQSDSEFKKVIVDYALTIFNLIDEGSHRKREASKPIFYLIRLHYEKDLDFMLSNLVPILVAQYKEYYKQFSKKDIFKGWDAIGCVTAGWIGGEITINDQLFITAILKPILQKHYDENPKKTFQFIKENLISSKQEQVNNKKPDFLNRSAIPILMQEYEIGEFSEEAYSILQDFITMRKGIPSKAELIFEIAQSLKDDGRKWSLVKYSLEIYRNLPICAFVERIASDLAKSGNQDAVELLKSWSVNVEYLNRQSTSGTELVRNITVLLDQKTTYQDGIDLLTTFYQSDYYQNPSNYFHVYDLAKLNAKVLELNFDDGLEILNLLYKQKLEKPQQIVLCNSLNNLSKDSSELIQKIYNEFIKPILVELGDIQNIENKFHYAPAREQFIHFADKLAEAGYIKEAMELIKIFIKDSNPPKDGSVEVNSPEGYESQHQRIKNSGDVIELGSIRGYCGWVLRYFCTLKGREFIETEIIPLVDILLHDSNYYVRYQAIFPLQELAKHRNSTVSTEDKSRFLSLNAAKRIVEICLEMIENEENQTLFTIMKHMAWVFQNIRTLDEKTAEKVLTIFKTNRYPDKITDKYNKVTETPYEMIINAAAPIFIGYAEFRKTAYLNSDPEFYGDGFQKLINFDDTKSKEMLMELINSDSSVVRTHLSMHFSEMPKEAKEDEEIFEQLFSIALHYISLLSQKYDHDLYRDIYGFVHDFMDRRYEQCIDLWKKCIKLEKDYIEKHYDEHNPTIMAWWPNHMYNEDALMAIQTQEGFDEFGKWLETLLIYPKEIRTLLTMDKIFECLMSNPPSNKKVYDIFNMMVFRNAFFKNRRDDWLEKWKTNNNDHTHLQ